MITKIFIWSICYDRFLFITVLRFEFICNKCQCFYFDAFSFDFGASNVLLSISDSH